MTRDELAKEQADGAASALFSLAMSCRRRFIRSADLVEMNGRALEALRAFGAERVDLEPLLPAWQRPCERYLSERYDSQPSLFREHKDQLLEAWTRFLCWHLFPALVRDDEVVRNVLRALEALPCQSPEAAVDALVHYVNEMTFPGDRPRWAPEEVAD